MQVRRQMLKAKVKFSQFTNLVNHTNNDFQILI